MKFKVLGKYGPFPPAGGATSGYLLLGENAKIAFEMGSGVFARLASACAPESLGALVISHLHYDHISDLGVLNYYLESLSRKGLLQSKLRLILPKADCPALSAIAAMEYFDIEFVSNGDRVEVNGVTLEFFSVRHPVTCLGFIAREGDKSFLYSADTDLFEGVENRVSSVSAALLDGAFLPSQYKIGGPHASCNACAKLSQKTGVKVYVTHLLAANGEDSYVEAVADAPLCRIVAEGEEYFV